MWVVLFSLFPLLGWGTSDYISSRYSKKLHLALINFVFSIGALLSALVLSLFLGFPEITTIGFILFFCTSAILTAGFLCMVRAYSVGATGIVSPIANSYAILTAIISVVFLHEKLELISLFAMCVIIIGMVLLTYKKDPSHNHNDFVGSVKYSILALIFFGVGFALFDVASTQEWYQNFTMFEITSVIVALSVLLVWKKKNYRKSIARTGSLKLLFLGSIIASIGTIGLFVAISHTENIAIPAAIAAAAPLVTAYLAYKFDNEHLTGIQRFASVVIVSGIVMLSV